MRKLIVFCCMFTMSRHIGALPPPPDFEVQGREIPKEIKDVSIEQKVGEKLPLELEFTEIERGKIKLGDIFQDGVSLVVPVYYSCPMLCNLVLDNLVKTLGEIGESVKYNFVVFSFDKDDTLSEAKNAYKRVGSKFFGDKSRWYFLIGDEDSIDSLVDSIGFKYVVDEETGQIYHAALVLVVSEGGIINRYLTNIDIPSRQLRLAMVEASEGKLGNIVDKLLLYCYQYDPTRGRYTLLVYRVLKLSAFFTVLLMATVIGGLLWREKKNRT